MLLPALAEAVRQYEDRLDRIERSIRSIDNNFKDHFSRWQELVSDTTKPIPLDTDGIQIQFPSPP